MSPEPKIRLDRVGKTYPGTKVPAVEEPDPRRPGGRDPRPRRPLRLRQEHHAAPDQPDDRAEQRPHPARRRGRHRRQPRQAAPPDRLRHPADRPVPAPDHRAEHRDRAQDARLGQGSGSPSASTSCSTTVGLDPEQYRDRYPKELSGGQAQRVGVARALGADPDIMLMDEPFGAIDPITRDRLQNEFLRLQAELRKTIVFVTHDIDEAIKMGDRIAILGERSTIRQIDTPERILAYPVDDFVDDFIGTGSTIKGLQLPQGQLADTSSSTLPDDGRRRRPRAALGSRRRAARTGWCCCSTRQGRPLRWLRPSDLEGAERVYDRVRHRGARQGRAAADDACSTPSSRWSQCRRGGVRGRRGRRLPGGRRDDRPQPGRSAGRGTRRASTTRRWRHERVSDARRPAPPASATPAERARAGAATAA